jgi:tetratricopeptide (TPR) repeat protein
MSDGYQILSLDELEPALNHQRDGQKLLAIQRALDYRPAGINGWIGDAGEGLVPEHAEDSDNEELYVVVRGRARFTVDGTDIDATAGTLLHLLPGESRVAVSEEPGTIVVVIGATIGEAFQNGGWTNFVIADALRREGRTEEAAVVIQELVELAPDVWYTHYNAACFHALAGNPDTAFRLLDEAARINTQEVRKWTAKDTDLDPLHDDPRWQRYAQ